jgi:translation initiation factor 3 subunit C
MSRFFHGGGSDSDSSSSDEEELYSDHEGEERSEEEESSEDDFSEDDSSEDESSEDEDRPKKSGALNFLRDEDEESEESEDEDRVTVVKSAKDKRLEEVEGTMKLIENAEKIGDWAVISTGELASQLRVLNFFLLL